MRERDELACLSHCSAWVTAAKAEREQPLCSVCPWKVFVVGEFVHYWRQPEPSSQQYGVRELVSNHRGRDQKYIRNMPTERIEGKDIFLSHTP